MERPPGCDGRRLRFDYVPRVNESIPGALIASLGPQWLDDARPVLEAAGLSSRRPGTLGYASPVEIRRLAWVMRCDPAALIARLGRKPPDDTGQGPIDFGDLVVPRRRFETGRLRMAPESFAAIPYHRIAWFDRALPFCPESLERLVDACQACGLPLRWTGTGRLGACGRCGAPLVPSCDPPLPSPLAEDYRAFAALSSPISASRRPVVERLPERLSSVPHGSLGRLALQLGGLLHDPPLATTSPNGWSGIAGLDLARAAASGWRMLEGWPGAVAEEYLSAARRLGRTRTTFERLRASLKRLVGPDEPCETRALVREALPDLVQHAGHSFAVGRRHYISRDVSRILGLKPVDVPRLRNWPDLRFVSVPGLSRTLGHYDADQIDELAALVRNSCSIESVSWALGLPVYGAEQLASAGLLQHRDHGAFVALGRDRQVSDPSVGELQKRLRYALRPGSAPASCIPLRLAMRSFGGGAKPWSAIVSALLRGDIHYWAANGDVRIQSLLVDDAAFIETIDRLPENERTHESIAPAETISKIDAAELLNLTQKEVGLIATELGICFFKRGRAMAARMSKVETVAERVIWQHELRRRLGCSLAELRLDASSLDLPNVAGGWCRRSAVAAGLPATISHPFRTDPMSIGRGPGGQADRTILAHPRTAVLEEIAT